MSFGKRNGTVERIPRPVPSSGSPAADVAGGGGHGLGNQLGRIGIGVAIALGLVALNYFSMRSAGSSLAANWERRGAGVTWSQIVPSPFKERTDQQRQFAKACLDLLHVRRTEGTTDESTFAWSLGRGEIPQMRAVGEYIACTIERFPERFCAASERTKLVADIRTFLGNRRTVLRRDAEEKMMSGGHPVRRFGDRRFSQESSAEAQADEDATLERIASTLKDAVEIGYFPGVDLTPLRGTELGEAITPIVSLTSREKPCK